MLLCLNVNVVIRDPKQIKPMIKIEELLKSNKEIIKGQMVDLIKHHMQVIQ